jgi:tetratricopeptide (TPR) repeat protein
LVVFSIKGHDIVEPMLVGRKQELAQLQTFLDLAQSGKGSTVMISGEAGSGKTRLAKEFLKGTRNVTVLCGWCLSNNAIPYFPFIEAFNSYSSTSEAQGGVNEFQQLKLKKWLTGQTENEDGNRSRQAWKDQTFASVTNELLLLSTQKPLIVFLDDVHWADSASLSLLQYLSHAVTYERILLLATFRSEEVGTQYNVSLQSLRDTLSVMGRDNLYSEIKLSRLGKSEVERIAGSMLRGKVSPKLVERLTHETSGNPLFVIESLKMLCEQNALTKENGHWTALDHLLRAPEKVKDVILRRINMLNPEARDVLEAGSVVGDKFDANLIGAVLEQSTVKVLSILNSISKSKSLVCCEQDWFRFDHPKTREVLYEEMSLPLKKEYHSRIAEKLEALKSSNEITFGDLAYHFVNAGNKQEAIKYSLEAGKEALAGFSNIEAIKHFQYVIDANKDGSALNENAVAVEGLADAYYADNRFEEAISTYRKLASFGGLVEVRGLRKAMDCAFFQNNQTLLNSLLSSIQESEITDNLEKARIIMNKARTASKSGDSRLSISYFEEALKLAEKDCSLWDVAWILIGLGSTRVWTSRSEQALAELLRAIAIFTDIADSRWLTEAYNAAGHALTAHFGLRKQGIDLLMKGLEVNKQAKVGDFLRLAQINAAWARAIASEGDLEGAFSKSLEALSYAERTDSDWGKAVVYANLTMFYSARGNAKKAQEFFDKIMQLSADAQHNSYAGVSIAKACLLACAQQWMESNLIFEKSISSLQSSNSVGVEATVRLVYADVLQKQGHTELAAQQRKTAQNLHEAITKKIEHAALYASLIVPMEMSTDKTFDLRLDLVNPSSTRITLMKITNVFVPNFQVKAIPTGSILESGALSFENQLIEPFSTLTIKLSIQPSQPGAYKLNPQITYSDKQSQTRLASTKTVEVHINLAPSLMITSKEEKVIVPTFRSASAETIYGFLVQAFNQDYLQRRMIPEKCGWRTLMDVVKGTTVSRYSLYASSYAGGQAVSELNHAGLIEVRFFEGERGRGGKVTKIRANKTIK